jgi:hypothetical protein
MMDGMRSAALRSDRDEPVRCAHQFAFQAVVDEICELGWEQLDADEVAQVADAYYYFSIQFRENLEIACQLYPLDEKLQELREGECNTDNLSPWPGVAADGEKLDHDEFMRRLLARQSENRKDAMAELGEAYLAEIRGRDRIARATSIASYEDGGLSAVFEAMLRAPDWRGTVAQGFKFFLEQHIRFDTDDGGGHGALSRHLRPDDKILPLWVAFRDLLVAAAPKLALRRAPHLVDDCARLSDAAD